MSDIPEVGGSLFFDYLYTLLAQGRKKRFDIFRRGKVGWDQIIQLIKCDGAGGISNLDCPSNNVR